ncbi:hypothetical protein [Thiohalomonas denitrificans]|nr:hypothetical protein [Thiohalomonas denitrificans]
MINAAVPIEAYASDQSHGWDGVEMLGRMTEDSWKSYRELDGSDKLFADGWHNLFTDSRKSLTWADRFRSVLGTKTYNFYSSGEDVVENPNPNETVSSSIWDVIIKVFTFNNQKGRHSWVAQEIAKGSSSLFIFTSMGSQHGGWGYNQAHGETLVDPPYWLPLGPQKAIELTESDLRMEPFFKRFEQEDSLVEDFDGDVLLAPNGDAGADEFAKDEKVQFKMLAEAVPARSFAAAANPVEEVEVLGNNFDMMDMKNDRWTTERPAEANGIRPWWHSDFRVVALNYTNPMWKKMIAVGRLDR